MPWGLNTIKVRAQYRMLTLTLSQNPKSHQGQNILKGWMPHGWLHNSGCWPWFWVVSSLDAWWCQGTSSEWPPRCSTSSMAWWPRSLQSLERETKHRDTEKITPWSQQHVHTHTPLKLDHDKKDGWSSIPSLFETYIHRHNFSTTHLPKHTFPE